jgi:SAM-dependent methyltransferase
LYEDQAFLAKVYLNEAVFVSGECWGKYRLHPESCMSVVKRNGQYHSVRKFFLSWLEAYLRKEGFKDAAVWGVLQKALMTMENIKGGNWKFRVAAGSDAELLASADDPAGVRIAIGRSATKTGFDIQLNQPHLELKANHRYAVRFRARADGERSINVGVAEAHEPWGGLGLYERVELTREWECFEKEFLASADENNARIHFDVGESDISVELSGVSLLSLSDGGCVEPCARPAQNSATQTDKELSGRPSRPGSVEFGELRRVTPISRNWGFDRGRPVDRYYIESFLARHADDIRGQVLEIGDNSYTREFGRNRVAKSDVLHVTEGNPQATIVADLTGAPQIPSGSFDCVILTQTLQLIYDVQAAIQTLYRILRPRGVLLATFPGISHTGDRDWGNDWCWNFTTASARRLFEEAFPATGVKVEAFGNVLAATSFLYGLAEEELTREELDYHEPGYAVTIAVKASKPGGAA